MSNQYLFPGSDSYIDVFDLYNGVATMRGVESMIIQKYPQFLGLTAIMQQVAGKPQFQQQRKFEIPRMGNTFPAQNIALRTTSGANLVLTWADPQFQSMYEGDMVRSSNGTYAQVIRSVPGEVEIKLPGSDYSATGDATFQAGDFPINTIVSFRGDQKNTKSTATGKMRVVEDPILEFNYIGLEEYVDEISREEFFKSTYFGPQIIATGGSGKRYGARQLYLNSLQRAYRSFSAKMLDAPRAYDGLGGYTAGGFEWQITNQGGVNLSYGTQVNLTNFSGAINTLVENGGMNGDEILIICGSKYMSDWQLNVGRDLVLTAGTNNTVGGTSVKGIDIKEYAFIGKRVKFIVDNTWSDPNLYNSTSTLGGTLQSRKAYFFNTDPVLTSEGMMPFVREYYYGSSPMSIVKGQSMIDENGAFRKEAPKNAPLSYTITYFWDRMWQLMNPAAHLIHSPQS